VFTIAGFDILRGRLSLVANGVWSAHLVPADDAVFARGQRVEIILGDLDLSATVIDGAVAIAGSSVFVVGGKGGWRGRVPRKAYRNDEHGVLLSQALNDLAKDVGEAIVFDAAIGAKKLGSAWMRAEGRGAEALDALGQPWRMRADGITEIGPLPGRASEGTFSLRPGYLPGLGVAMVDAPLEEFSELVPGVTVTLADDVSIKIGDVCFFIDNGTAHAEIMTI